jgi:ppGpp synthetase/RelA/SpoT-type nucleotidyltranferase
MKRNDNYSYGRATLLAFVANLLLDGDVAVASSSARPTVFVRQGRRHRDGTFLSTAFVHQHHNEGAAAAVTVSFSPSVVGPRHFVKDDGSSSQEALPPSHNGKDPVSSSVDGEFSLLRRHLEFSELDLQLFAAERTAHRPRGLDDGVVDSQLYDEFVEVEIGQFYPSEATEAIPGLTTAINNEGSDESSIIEDNINCVNGVGVSTLSSSPFFFASRPQEVRTTTTTSSSTSTAASSPYVNAQREDPTLPPWLLLNNPNSATMKLIKLRRDLGPHISSKQIDRIVRAIRSASNNDLKKQAGAADFCSLLVNSLEMTDPESLCAAAFHYASLVAVRERELSLTMTTSMGTTRNNNDDDSCPVEENECLYQAGPDAKYLCALAGSGIEDFGSLTVKIALDAARLKSMESLAAAVMSLKNGRLGPLRSSDARNLRSLLLTVNEEGDWRALAIRSAACLYRLEGLTTYRSMMDGATPMKNTELRILARRDGSMTDKKTKTRPPTSEESRTSQEALHIYAPFAARLGMFRLKTELEDAAFRTLCPRSHAKVLSLCRGENTNSVDDGEGMKSILSDISNQIKRLVQEDTHFMDNIESVSVMARVKEPYSVWRKMLKIIKEDESKKTRNISILDIPDALATRIVFSARKLTSDEPDTTTQHREEELCYYLFELCKRSWPETADSRFKDYVKNPKENGYQSLHYSSRKRWRGTDWPFELQIRSRAMHRVAEYGVAAHWSYKRTAVDGDETASSSNPTFVSTHRLDKTSEAYLKSAQEWRTQQARQNSIPSYELTEPATYLEDEIRRQRKRDRDEVLAPYLEALSGAQTDITRENVFVFVSVQPCKSDDGTSLPPCEGTVLSLPQGSRLLDAIRLTEKCFSSLPAGSGHLYDGRSTFVALRNGKRTSAMGTELLKSGDFLSILPSSELVSSRRSS